MTNPSSTRPGMSWTQNGMYIIIKDHNEQVMTIYLGEAIDGAGEQNVINHLKYCKIDLGWELIIR